MSCCGGLEAKSGATRVRDRCGTGVGDDLTCHVDALVFGDAVNLNLARLAEGLVCNNECIYFSSD